MAKRSVRKCWVPVAAAAAAATLIGPTPAAASGPVAATAGTTAAAALIVGGTTFPTLEQSFMAELWPTWNRSLGLANPAAPELINVAYPAQLAPFTDGDPLGVSVAAGVSNLLNLISATYSVGAHLLVWGISQGALVLNGAQQILASDPAVAPPPDALTFIRVADPAAAITGVLNFLPAFIMSEVLRLDNAARTAPADSQFNTIVVTNEFDGFADFPDRFNLVAVANALAGLMYRHAQTGIADLTSVPAQKIAVTTNALGATTTTYLVPSPFLPLTQPLREAGVPTQWVDALDDMLWPVVKAGYSRNDPAPATAVAAQDPLEAPTQIAEIPPAQSEQNPAAQRVTAAAKAAAPSIVEAPGVELVAQPDPAMAAPKASRERAARVHSPTSRSKAAAERTGENPERGSAVRRGR